MGKIMNVLGLVACAGFFGWVVYTHIAVGGHDPVVCVTCGGMAVFCLYCAVRTAIDKDE